MYQQANKYFACPDDGTLYDVHDLFQYYNVIFFEEKLNDCVVRWTNRMTQCAGTCKYQGYGASTIALSQPLLKFRSSNQVKQTLLHEMIHAFLFKTNIQACKTNGGHGTQFIKKMNEINDITGLKLSVYHQFHDEVNFYRQHVWRCNGPCRDNPPFYGYVRRSMNRAPQPADYWWNQHKRQCGGQFVKISEPKTSKEKQSKQNINNNNKKKKKKISQDNRDHKSWGVGKTIDEYMKQMSKQNKKNKKQYKKQKSQQAKNQALNSNTYFTNISLQSFQIQSEINIMQNSYDIKQVKKVKTLEQYCQQIQKQKQQQKKKMRIN